MTVGKPFVSTLAVAALIVGASAPKSAYATSAPAPTAPAVQTARPPVPPPPAPTQAPVVAPAPPAGASTPTPAAQVAGQTTPPAPGAAPAGRGRGTPPPPPQPPPAVMPAPIAPIVSMAKPSPDPRVGLKAGVWDAGQAGWNMKLLSTTPPNDKTLGITHSDLAFTGKYAIQGQYNGFDIYDISNPLKPVLTSQYICPASQNDVSVYKNLLFMSSEATNSRSDCGFGGVPDPISKDRVRGIRIFDISDIKAPKLVTSVQNCRGSHTHTVVEDPADKLNVYIYISGTSGVRSAEELPGCKDNGQEADSSRFKIEIIKVPLANPGQAAIVNGARIFQNLAPGPRNPERDAASGRGAGAPGGGPVGAGVPPAAGAAAAGAPPVVAGGGATAGVVAGGAAAAPGAPGAAGPGRGGRGAAGPPTGPNQCHDITVYPAMGLAGGACAGLGLLLDIREAAYPVRIDFVGDANMSFWHSATFSNDGQKVLFSDEWGGGTAPRCRDTDKMEWGADAIFAIEKNKMVFKSYYKMPAAQTANENCVAHNGSLIPIPGRDVMVQAWYQGGVSVFDWTDPAKPFEIAYFDRGPMSAERLMSAGSWSVYYYNGYLVSSEIARGLDVYELLPSGLVTQNELDAAKTVHLDFLNAQGQPKIVWPPSFAMAKALVDQLERSSGLAATRITQVRAAIAKAENLTGAQRRTALTTLSTSVKANATGSTDAGKVRMLATALTDLANAR